MAMTDTIEEFCPKSVGRKKPWIDDACWRLTELRRAVKQRDMGGMEHKEACKKVKKALCKAKWKWYREKLQQAEDAQQRGDSKTVYKTVKQICRKQGAKLGIGIKDEYGCMHDIDDICTRWKEYCAKLYHCPDRTEEDMDKGDAEPEV